MLEVYLLGRFEVKYGTEVIPITSRPSQSLFAFLILNAGTTYRREKLAGMLWSDSLEKTARDNLRHALWRIRKALPQKTEKEFINADDLTITFNASSDFWLDAAELENTNEKGSSGQLIDVLSLYQGELLPGFYDDWVVLEREHLASAFEHHMARLMSLLEDEKRWLDIISWGERWIKLGSKPEPAYRALMSAHAAKGDMSRVAATYERCVKSLKELGIGPSEQTRVLFEKLKVGKEALETESTIRIEENLKKISKTNLPVPITSFIGRKKEVDEIVQLMDRNRLVTLTGPGGVGKTRLAIQSSGRMREKFSDGIWWVELAPLIDEILVPQAVAQVLGVRESSARPVAESIKSYLREKQLLLILDNCEHLIGACAQFAHELLTQCASLRILTTSREALDIMGEFEYPVQPLYLPEPEHLTIIDLLLEYEGIRLFVERANVKSGFTLTERNATAVAQICQSLDGIPLAIELAAARTKTLTVEQIAERLNDRFNLLTRGNRTALPRHQTLRGLIDWSYDLLSEEEQVLFRRLAVFAGGWTLEAAEAVCSDRGIEARNNLNLLMHLVDRSLVLVQEQKGETRYKMLETIREYARERLSEGNEIDSLRGRHASFFTALARLAEPELRGLNQGLWFERLDAENSNFRSALAWSRENDIELGAQLAGNLFWFWHVRCHWAEGLDWFMHLLEPEGQQSLTVTLKAQMLYKAGWLAYDEMDINRMMHLSEQGLRLCREVADKPGTAMALNTLGWAAHYMGDYSKASWLADQSLVLYRELELNWGVADVFNLLGELYRDQGDFESAAEFYNRSLACSRVIGDIAAISYSLSKMGLVAWHQGNLELAAKLTEESLPLSREVQLEWNTAMSLNILGDVARAKGDYDRASMFYDESEAIWERLGNKREIGTLFWSQGWLARLQGKYIQATRYFEKGLILWQEAEHRQHIAECLEGLAGIAVAIGKIERAICLLGASETIREQTETPLSPQERREYERDIGTIHAQLNEETFNTIWGEGSSMTLEEAIEFALEKT